MQAPRNPSPRQSSGARSSGYYCRDLHRRPVQRDSHPAFSPRASAASYPSRTTAGRGSGAPARSIFRARRFGRWVVTHSLEDADCWGHLPAVATGGHRSAGPGDAPWPGVRIIPLRPSCLPGGAHSSPAFLRPAQASGGTARPFGVWGAGEGQAPRYRRPALYEPQLLRRRLSWETFRRQPATRRFDESFAPMPSSDERFARQHRGGPPPGFRPASPSPGIDHRLSGPRVTAQPTQSLIRSVGHVRLAFAPPRGIPRARRDAWLLGPCYETGPALPAAGRVQVF